MFILGFLYAKIVDKIKEHFKDQKLLKDMILQFEEILSNIKKGQAVFVSRVNHTVMLDTKLKDYNIVNVVYLMDKSIVCIFKENKCIYTSETIDKKLNELPRRTRKLFFVSGGVDTDERERIREITEGEKDAIIVASMGTFSTGINIRNLHNIVFASPSKSQRLSRGRQHQTLPHLGSTL
jgi:hypothetical protein